VRAGMVKPVFAQCYHIIAQNGPAKFDPHILPPPAFLQTAPLRVNRQVGLCSAFILHPLGLMVDAGLTGAATPFCLHNAITRLVPRSQTSTAPVRWKAPAISELVGFESCRPESCSTIIGCAIFRAPDV